MNKTATNYIRQGLFINQYQNKIKKFRYKITINENNNKINKMILKNYRKNGNKSDDYHELKIINK